MSVTVTITADTGEDPYSAFWAKVSDDEMRAVEQYFAQSPQWTQSMDVSDIRVLSLFAAIESHGRPMRLYITTQESVVDAAADTVEKLLQRGPDSLS